TEPNTNDVLFSLLYFAVVLLDTTKEATLEWTRYPYGPQAQTPGWVEESFTNFVKGINWRSYVVCDVAYNNVNNWLWSPFIDRGPANRLYIEIHFTIRDCSLFPGNALSCKETFSLLFYEFDAATREPPPWQPESYKLIGRIAAGEGRFNQNSDVDINVEVKSIAVTKKGVYFAFRDQGACISVLAVKVYYITCPAVTVNFAHFNETPTGREVTIIEQQQGVCVANAEAYEPPTYLCKGDGKWTILTGGCRCKVGYEPDADKQTCNVCPVGTFRSAEVRACTICPLNAKTNKVGSPFCPCLSGHYRHPRDGRHMPCYKPPGPPTNLTLLFIDQTSAILSWNAPQRAADEQLDSKFRSDIVFRVRCAACTSNVVFNPSSETFNDTKLTLTNLEPVTTYTVQVHSQHGVSYPIVSLDAGGPGGAGGAGYENGSSMAGGYHATEPPMVVVNARGGGAGAAGSDLDDIKTEFAEITFTTESAILSTVFNVKVVQITNKDVDLMWDKPIHSDSPIEYYEVRWFPKSEVDAMNKSVLSTKESKVHIGELLENTEYGFQVRCKTLNGWGTFSNIVYAQTHQSVSPVYDDSFQMRIVAGTTVTVVFILVLVIVITVVFLRSKNHDEIDKKTNNHLPLPLDYASNEVTTPLFGTSRSYVDPHTYEDPNQAIREFAREIDASYITIEAIIGKREMLAAAAAAAAAQAAAAAAGSGGGGGGGGINVMGGGSSQQQQQQQRAATLMMGGGIGGSGTSERVLNNGSSSMTNVPGSMGTLGSTVGGLSNTGTMAGSGNPGIFISTDLWLEGIKMSRYSQHFKEAGLVTAQQQQQQRAATLMMGGGIGGSGTSERVLNNGSSSMTNVPGSMGTLGSTVGGLSNTGTMAGSGNPGIFISTDLWLEGIKMSRYSQHFKEAGLVTAQQLSRLTAQQLSDMGITLVGHQKKILHQARQIDTII
uniref:Uncharacterized protein n=1 Tax=Anopheles dirus TaxID=7168 RepID=A0A182N159_9DIPT